MKTIVLYHKNLDHYGRVQVCGTIICNHLYFDEDVEAAITKHLQDLYEAYNIVFDRSEGSVTFTFGGGLPVTPTYVYKLFGHQSVTIWERETIRLADGTPIYEAESRA